MIQQEDTSTDKQVKFSCDEIHSDAVSLARLQGIDSSRIDCVETMYFDESGNDKWLKAKYKKIQGEGFIIRDVNANIRDLSTFFVLGGIQTERTIARDKFLGNMELSLGEEVKSKDIFPDCFMKNLSKKRFCRFLDVIEDLGAVIHFFAVNPLYYVFTDIIDSIMAETCCDEDIPYIYDYKDVLYQSIKLDVSSVFSILSFFKYPDIRERDKNLFIRALINLCKSNPVPRQEDEMNRLISFLDKGQNIKDLPFIQNTRFKRQGDLFWVDPYIQFYIDRIATFAHKRMIFDNEDTIKESLKKFRFVIEDMSVNWCMRDSINEPMLQISDLVVGVMRKYLTFISRDKRLVIRDCNSLRGIARDNFARFSRIMLKSLLERPEFQKFICPKSMILLNGQVIQDYI